MFEWTVFKMNNFVENEQFSSFITFQKFMSFTNITFQVTDYCFQYMISSTEIDPHYI